jgi:hypothetical protein
MPTAHRPAAKADASGAWTTALIALCVSLTTPIWYDEVLRTLGVPSAVFRAQMEDSLVIARQERKLQDVQQRLGATVGQLAQAQAALAQAARRQEEASNWTRVLILARLGEALRVGQPFVAEMAMVRGVGATVGEFSPLMARVAPYAPIGVPTAADLARDFRRVTEPVLRPNRGLNPLSWATAVWNALPFTPVVPDADPDRAALREAVAQLQSGNLIEAVTLARTVSGPLAAVVAGWLADADARFAADLLNQRVDGLLREGRRS